MVRCFLATCWRLASGFASFRSKPLKTSPAAMVAALRAAFSLYLATRRGSCAGYPLFLHGHHLGDGSAIAPRWPPAKARGDVARHPSGKSLRDDLRPPLTAAARSSQRSTDRDEEMSQPAEQGDGPQRKALTPIAPYKSLGLADARLLLLRSVFKQPVAELLRRENAPPAAMPRHCRRGMLNTTRWDVVLDSSSLHQRLIL